MSEAPLEGLEAFVTVARLRSFSAAATRLSMSPSAVSQAVRTLERRLGVALFHRTTRSVSLTEAGEAYLARVGPALQELTAAAAAIGENAAEPSGLLRLNVPRSAYMIVLQPILTEFLERYPAVDIDVVVDGARADIVEGGYDAGIRFGDLIQKDMIAVPVGPSISAFIVASPDYLARFGTPQHPRDLLQHRLIAFRPTNTGQVEKWEFEKDGEKLVLPGTGRLTCNDLAALTQAALDGLGVSYLINGHIDGLLKQGKLARLLEDWSPPLAGFHIYFADRRHVAPKLRAFIDFLKSRKWAAPSNLDAYFRAKSG
ncbi:LysR family transcriptional regulator [Neorhizobium sp. DT-125]|uniref:LysR family transcriptional regulator n=1 Tax=Neorhizobium sp. DT-125 TaxID=3396163 RepID=UPI003F1C79F1